MTLSVLGLLVASLTIVACGGDDGAAPDACTTGPGCAIDGGADGGPTIDGGPREDAGADGGLSCSTPANAGDVGGQCRADGSCAAGSMCAEEVTHLPGTGVALTLSNGLSIPTAASEDPTHPGEYLVTDGLPEVPIGFGPGGQCTVMCTPGLLDDACGPCATCSATLGGFGAGEGFGFNVGLFVDAAGDAVCRQNCAYDAADQCSSGYACSAAESVCLEACTADAQCQATSALSRHDGLVAVLDPAAHCNTASGRCEWTPTNPAATAGSLCAADTDCPSPLGACAQGGLCITYQCNVPDPADPSGATPLHPCATGSICLGVGGNDSGACVKGCDSVDDCPAGNRCALFGDPVGGFAGACFGDCIEDADCHTNERCATGGAVRGMCAPFCIPADGAPDVDATICAADELCDPVPGWGYGLCTRLNQLCFDDTQCVGGQTCMHLGDDALGRCGT